MGDIEWLFDPIRIFDGASVSADKLGEYSGFLPGQFGHVVGDRCPGSICPQIVVSTDNVVTVQFVSDSLQSGKGFEIRYHSADAQDVSCGYGNTFNCTGHGA